jgi:protein-L-isoaspartate(D-aspartate) O-methyltransferase
MSDTASKPPKASKFPLRLNQLATVPKLVKAAPTPLKTTPVRRVAAPSAAVAAVRAVLRPQALLQQSVDHATNAKSPSGVGLDSADVRARMVERLRVGGIQHTVVLTAMAQVQRHRFVDSALVIQAYEDTSLPIGHGQTISKPSVVARMLELLMGSAQARASNHLGKVLEIGTGCGYQAAVLACMAKQVVSVERVKALHDKARDLLADERGGRMRLVYGDGMRGHAPNAPYDSIIAAAGGDALPEAWLAQLALGGRLVAPVEMGSSRQALVVVDHTERGFERHVFETVQFVPLKSGMVR